MGDLQEKEIADAQILKKWPRMKPWFGRTHDEIICFGSPDLNYSTYRTEFPAVACYRESHVKVRKL